MQRFGRNSIRRTSSSAWEVRIRWSFCARCCVPQCVLHCGCDFWGTLYVVWMFIIFAGNLFFQSVHDGTDELGNEARGGREEGWNESWKFCSWTKKRCQAILIPEISCELWKTSVRLDIFRSGSPSTLSKNKNYKIISENHQNSLTVNDSSQT